MKKTLILCAPVAMVLASCSTSHMGALVPESRETEYEGIAVQGWNTGSVITYGKNYKTGYMETANVTVYQDSGIDNAAKLATAAGTLAWGTGTVMQGIGAMDYADAWESIAETERKLAHTGYKYHITGDVGTNVEVNGGSYSGGTANASAGASSASEASAGASAYASGGGKPKPPHGGGCGPHGGGGMGGH